MTGVWIYTTTFSKCFKDWCLEENWFLFWMVYSNSTDTITTNRSIVGETW
ncbi:hypothetical protein ZOSMA_90G00130 [Zostera marina]|uniref:Uncharacterized protein n=1 Tax=Zostera marina TaxID=29655 RepID=A0A0K9NJP7_ZOSMR|nr:hypothetical protein ZOSMA_90G00130 [Zostera marina]